MKYLLRPVKEYFKANLHTHSSLSDGALTVAELKQEYKKRGYKILCVTDHEMCFDHSAQGDDSFLFLTGYEMMTYDENPRINSKTYHINFIAKRADNRWQYHHPDLRGYVAPVADKLIFDKPEIRFYSPEEVKERILKAAEKGFLVIYNHPAWSLQSFEDYEALEGLWGVEIFNTGSWLDGFDDDMSGAFQDLLMIGKNPGLVPIAADDAHIPAHIGGGWIMIGAESLKYEKVIEAMERGDVYASTGPEIHSLTLEEGKVRITCSEAANINFITHGRLASRVFPKKDTPLTEAVFDLSSWKKQITEDKKEIAFFRLCITDEKGKKAYTRAYTLRDIEE